jgi:hypothetical protein
VHGAAAEVGAHDRAMEAEEYPRGVGRAGEAHDVAGGAVGPAYLRHDRCLAFEGVFERSGERLRTRRHHALRDIAIPERTPAAGRWPKAPREGESHRLLETGTWMRYRAGRTMRSLAAGPGRALFRQQLLPRFRRL